MIDLEAYKAGAEFEADFQEAIYLEDGFEAEGIAIDAQRDLNFREVETKNGTAVIVEITFHFQSPEIEELTQNNDYTAKWSGWLDFDGGKISTKPGANNKVRLLRKALKQDDGRPWSFQRVIGVPVKCKLGVDPNADGELVYPVVKQVRAA